MKILYAIQGTGNGHLSRARDIIPILQRKAELDILISGTEADVDLPFEVKYRYKGLSFVFGKKGGIDLMATYKKGNLKRLYSEIRELPIEEYDLVINDFEPVSAWACKFNNVPCIGLSHQAAVINKKSPKPKNTDIVGKVVLKNYAPVDKQFGFHFQSYAKSIFTPVVRKEIRNAIASEGNYYTVYLPSYSDKKILKVLSEFPDVQWEVFSKHSKEPFNEQNVSFRPINNDDFIKSFTACKGILCGAGFETPAEAMFLKKKLMVIPMKGQYEQQCNAAALELLGVPVIKSLKLKHLEKIENWLEVSSIVSVDYPDITEQIIDEILSLPLPSSRQVYEIGETPFSSKKFWSLNFGKIINQISK